MTPKYRLTIYCGGTSAQPHRECKLGVCHLNNSGDVVGTADFATPILNGSPVTGEDRIKRSDWLDGVRHYRLRIECQACSLSVEYHGPDELLTTISARAFAGESRLSLAQLIEYASI